MKLVWLLLFLATSTALAAEDSGLCPNSRTQSELNDCASKIVKTADASLENFYKTYIKRLSPEQIELFQSANTEWRHYRQAYCKFVSGGPGGSAYPMVFDLCAASQSTSRLQELRKLSQCHEGFGCPVW